MRLTYFCIIILIVFSCKKGPKKVDHKIDDEIAQVPSLYYNIDTTHLFIQNATVQKNENVGEILNRNNIDFIQIDKIAKLAKKIFDLRNVKAGANYTIMFTDSSKTIPKHFSVTSDL